MSYQSALVATATQPTPADGGLWARYVTDNTINHAAWLQAIHEHGFVGTCRRCADYLTPDWPYVHAGRSDYTARCRNTACGYELTAPGGRVMRGSARKSDQQRGQ